MTPQLQLDEHCFTQSLLLQPPPPAGKTTSVARVLSILRTESEPQRQEHLSVDSSGGTVHTVKWGGMFRPGWNLSFDSSASVSFVWGRTADTNVGFYQKSGMHGRNARCRQGKNEWKRFVGQDLQTHSQHNPPDTGNARDNQGRWRS